MVYLRGCRVHGLVRGRLVAVCRVEVAWVRVVVPVALRVVVATLGMAVMMSVVWVAMGRRLHVLVRV